MRAKRVPAAAIVFDFDDTLVKTDAKVYVYKGGKRIKSLTTDEYRTYVKKSDETLDLEDFKDPRMILNARKYKMWPALRNIYSAKEQGRSNSDIYILTGRPWQARDSIYSFFSREGINIPIENIITIGNDEGDIDIAEVKKSELKKIRDNYGSIMFYDDNPENIKLAGEVGGIQTKLIDWNK